MAFLLCVIVAFSGATYVRNYVWHDVLTMAYDRAKKSPGKARVHNDLGNALDEHDFFDEAVRSYQRALELDPQFQIAHFNLGLAYFRHQQFDDAAKEFQVVLSLNPSDARARDYLRAIYEIKFR